MWVAVASGSFPPLPQIARIDPPRRFKERCSRQNHGTLRLALMESPTLKTALVLAGGGSLGAVQAGMLIELVAAGLRPDFVVRVSAGVDRAFQLGARGPALLGKSLRFPATRL